MSDESVETPIPPVRSGTNQKPFKNKSWKGKGPVNRKFGPEKPSEPVTSFASVPKRARTAPHGGTPEFEKSKKPIMDSMSPRYPTGFPVYVGTTGLPRLCRIVRDTICSKDTQLSRLLSSNMLTYVATLATYYRMGLTAAKSGTVIIDDLSKLARYVKDLKLPIAICDYIESIGSCTLANGATVVPVILSTLDRLLSVDALFENIPLRMRRERYRRLAAHHYYLDHRVYEQQLLNTINVDPEGIEVFDPLAHENGDERVTAWQLIPSIVNHYKKNIRYDKVGLAFREVNNEELVGKSTMLISPIVNDGTLVPTAPEATSQADGKKGSVYLYRTADPASWVPATGNYLLEGRTFTGNLVDDTDGYITNLVRQSLLV